MAEKLKTPQPSSSIANALSIDAVRAATQRTPLPPQVPTGSAVVSFPVPERDQLQQGRAPLVDERQFPKREPTGEVASIVRHFQLTAAADSTLKQLIEAYSQATGLELTKSEFLRAMLWALSSTIDLHRREAATIGRLRRTRNEAWLLHKRDELERAIARAFIAAMRAAPAMT